MVLWLTGLYGGLHSGDLGLCPGQAVAFWFDLDTKYTWLGLDNKTTLLHLGKHNGLG